MPMLPSHLTSRLRQHSLSCLLAFALLLGQLASLLHKLEFDVHPAGEVCAICIVIGHTDAALPSLPFTAPAPVVVFSQYFHSEVAPRARHSFVLRARGPPVLA
ncbi:MAG: hypothetical protein H7A08_10165 [Oceanospirillaceae bacterium]|nr:hypothetical protein [Oceanospirillaceae bacterium]MCP5349671.1 hypothetical protein [Oceanospirillaceae bacterium]